MNVETMVHHRPASANMVNGCFPTPPARCLQPGKAASAMSPPLPDLIAAWITRTGSGFRCFRFSETEFTKIFDKFVSKHDACFKSALKYLRHAPGQVRENPGISAQVWRS
ncbi:hypothetical protein PZ897_03810 [Hoeflea sp. YIM 152468]|uniref:hypothetical protein n=1 Tax=Hoeflea sp. YIM 152468 TaxID=3031759 RepID=UPI0023DBDF5C|nr:hypothetical protein [Hoeflea sp. YIM 152468]MDF1607297.1 hypothetical protein [Hoeflea sp. YIM 152468]